MTKTVVVDADERLQALNPLASFCVSAPAGSGKTELLIQRFLTLLARVEQPEQVLAITFTRKAAAEMRERVMEALAQAQAQTPCTGEHEMKTRALAQAVIERDQQARWHLQQASSRFNIKTIDGFCSQLARQMPLLSAFGGAAKVVDNPDELYREAVADLYAGLDQATPINDDLAALLLHFDNKAARLESLLMTMLAKRDQWFEAVAAGLNPDMASARLVQDVSERVEEALTRARELLCRFEASLAPLLRFAQDNLGASPCDDWPATDAEHLWQWQALQAMLCTKAGQWRKQINKTAGFPASGPGAKERKQQWQDVMTLLRDNSDALDALQTIPTLPRMDDNDTRWQRVVQLTRVLPHLAAHLLLVFQRRGEVDFTQVSLSALDALGQDDAPTDLALRLDYGIAHILVDEFQDTAINQYRLVQRLTRDWAEYNAENPDNPHTLMVVGDAMQSIYSFRDANVSLFLKARNEGFNGVRLTPLQLRCNFRSDDTLVHWVNRIFSRAFPQKDDIGRSRVCYSKAEAIRAGGVEQAVTCQWYEGETCDEQEITTLCDHIAQGVADEDCRSIAVLGRSRSHLQPVMQALEARGIAYSAQDMAELTASPVVQGLTALCQALTNRADSLAWMSLLRAPWCGLVLDDLLAVAQLRRQLGQPSLWYTLNHSDLPRWVSADGLARIAPLREALQWGMQRQQRLPLRVWIEQIWLRLQGPEAAADCAGLDDAEQVFQVLEKMEQAGQGLDINRLQQRLEAIRISRDVAASKVQIMTLHKSKGLEFDWVFIPCLARLSRSDDRPLLQWDEHINGAGHRSFLLAADDKASNDAFTLYNYLSAQKKQKQALERTRLLYVGATRAVKRLFLSGAVKLDKTGDEIAAPSASSLLATVWPHVVPGSELVYCDDAEPNGTAQVTQYQFRRLDLRHFKTSAALAGAARTDEPEAGAVVNHPQRLLNWRERHLGTVIHAALEDLAQTAILPDSIGEQAMSSSQVLLRQFGFSGNALTQALATVRAALNTTLADADGRWLLSARQEAHTEWAITGIDDNDRLRDWVIDRSFVDNGQYWLIDYKSSQPRAGESETDFLARETAHYRDQLQGYQKAVAGMDDRPVVTALYFPLLGKLHRLPQRG